MASQEIFQVNPTEVEIQEQTAGITTPVRSENTSPQLTYSPELWEGGFGSFEFTFHPLPMIMS